MMKKYLKPEAEYVEFESERITDIGQGNDGPSDNDYGDDDFGGQA